MEAVTIISIIIAIVGMILGIAGYLSTRDNQKDKDAEWRGTVNAKLDIIVGIQTEVKETKGVLQDLESRVRILEKEEKERE